jgi:hypothetical protein
MISREQAIHDIAIALMQVQAQRLSGRDNNEKYVEKCIAAYYDYYDLIKKQLPYRP